ncbi:solute carrier family 28 member 3-like isoform X1 [Acropora muricata]|uniref:solute carrier family 28 member 3-like isoform X2 n=1 Tax=Acropora millepora TaxID=45264 RepID=UPI001CF35452|nr:solute carrier family 28 member 3-like isoform X2 [Acropora millepora]
MERSNNLEMVSVNIAEVRENGRPGGNSVKKNQRKLRFRALEELWQDYSFQIVVVIISFVLLIYTVAAIAVSGFHQITGLFAVSMVFCFCVMYMFVRDYFGGAIYKQCCTPVISILRKNWRYLRWVVLLVVLVLLGLWFGLDTAKEPKRFISLLGMLVYVGISYVLSIHRKRIKWRPVLWGMSLQLVFALIILRTSQGFQTFKFLGDTVTRFLEYTDAGSAFVFGDDFETRYVAFKVLPVIIFFSSFISVLYYLGIMPLIISKIAWLMQITMGTSAAESLSAAGNIFVGQTEAPLLIRPFLASLTQSELHAVMTGGLATVAGGILAAFVGVGIQASHLIAASVMSAPAALAVSKIMCPETEVPETLSQETIHFEPPAERNVIEAAAKGASTAITLVANVLAMLITFFAFIAFFNGVLSFLGSMVGYPELSFQVICSYVFMPFAFLMGVDWADCQTVGRFLGVKTFLNEFIAYIEMGPFIENRNKMNGGPTISRRSEVIATYALCGFTNFLGLGVLLGGLGPMAPSRQGDMARFAIRSLFAATIACFMTASIAGFLYDESLEASPAIVATINTTLSPTTIS